MVRLQRCPKPNNFITRGIGIDLLVSASQVSLEIENPKTISVIISGKIYNYRERFHALGFQSGRAPPSAAGTKGRYVQILKSIDVPSEEAKVLDIFGEKCLKNMAVKVVLDGACREEDDSTKLIGKLRELPNLFF